MRPLVSGVGLCVCALGLVGLAAGCESPPPERAPVTFVLPSKDRGNFLDTPFPSDLMIEADGTLDFRSFPNPFNSATLEDYLVIFETAPAWAASTTLYFHVEGGVDESTLPQTPAASVADDSGLFVLELSGPNKGRRLPIEWKHYPEGTSFLPPGTTAVNLLLGAVPTGRYALIATSTVHRTDGLPLGPSEGLQALFDCELPDTLDRDVDCGPYQQVLQDLGVDDFDVGLVQVITPQQSTTGLEKAYAVARDATPSITVTGERAERVNDPYRTFDGVITIAHFQAGRAPYDRYDGTSGGFVTGDDGVPQIQGTEEVPFVLTIPKGPMPATGWPVVVNGHGTGGDLESGLGSRPGAEAFHITQAGAAMFAISEPLHNTREGYREGQEETLTFNFFNPLAGRDNWRQSALEKVQQLSALEVLTFDVDGDEVFFDPTQFGYFGHSQGGIVGALFVAVEERLQGSLLSGAGAGFAPSIIEKVDPIKISEVLKLVLSIPDEEEVDVFHPVPALLQTFVDAADPLNYGRLWRHPARGHTGHLVMTSGLQDTFTPPRNHAGLAGAFGLPQAEPVSVALDILTIGDLPVLPQTFGGDLENDDGSPLTAGLVQFPSDGHFAIFNNPSAQDIFTQFFSTLFDDGVPTVTSTR